MHNSSIMLIILRIKLKMNHTIKSARTALIIGISVISMSPAYAEIANDNSHDYKSGVCIKNEVVREVSIDSDTYIKFRVQNQWFKYYNYATKADAQGAYKALMASLLTGNKISANYGTSSCSGKVVSSVYLHDS